VVAKEKIRTAKEGCNFNKREKRRQHRETKESQNDQEDWLTNDQDKKISRIKVTGQTSSTENTKDKRSTKAKVIVRAVS